MIIEEETQKRVEELVAKRVEEQLAKRKDEIDAEVMKRVEEAKSVMEKQMVEEFEKRRQEQLEEQQMKEVKNLIIILCLEVQVLDWGVTENEKGLVFFPSDCKISMSTVHMIHLHRNKIGAM